MNPHLYVLVARLPPSDAWVERDESLDVSDLIDGASKFQNSGYEVNIVPIIQIQTP